MPYASKSQAAYMHIHHPEIAKRWDAEMKAHHEKVKGLPEHANHSEKHSHRDDHAAERKRNKP